MTPRNHAIVTSVVTTAITLLGMVVLGVLTGAWAGKENTADHRDDVREIRNEVQRMRDVICLDHRYAPQCQPIPSTFSDRVKP